MGLTTTGEEARRGGITVSLWAVWRSWRFSCGHGWAPSAGRASRAGQQREGSASPSRVVTPLARDVVAAAVPMLVLRWWRLAMEVLWVVVILRAVAVMVVAMLTAVAAGQRGCGERDDGDDGEAVLRARRRPLPPERLRVEPHCRRDEMSVSGWDCRHGL